jgi:membrane-bound lytic murein transglycosylase A
VKTLSPFSIVYLTLGVLLVAGLYHVWPRPVTPEPDEAEPTLSLTVVGYDALRGWAEDDQSGALAAFRRSCAAMLKQPDDKPLDGAGFAGTIADWRGACEASSGHPDAAARAFFEQWFQPVAIAAGSEATGLFTGYYAPIVEGSRAPDERHTVPLYRMPPELVMLDLGLFRPAMKGERIAGRVEGNRLVPYATRAEIVAGALANRGLEIMWLADPVDAFFLQIQGSGLVRLPEGGLARLGYAGQNGHPYTPVGRLLIQRGELTREEVSMQRIRDWITANPGPGAALMDENQSYVFFEEQQAEGAIGAQGVPLTGGRSLAIDRKYMPLGAPFWLESVGEDGNRHIARLVIAQDTGGAIRGMVRGDFYWGEGDEAEHSAGGMKDKGRYHVLLPRPLAERIAAAPAAP